jgi:hypothetical protein
MPLLGVPLLVSQPAWMSPQKSQLPLGPDGFPHSSGPEPPSSHASPVGRALALNGAYSASCPGLVYASARATLNEWPYAGTPSTSWLSGMPAACQAATDETAEPSWFAATAQVSLSGPFGPT